ncbi:hypothetical protein [Kitasatospora sp. KL5]|uniref:hypothetical protein n=1 Tax=Kitasatospora sp. KL5 TaxID=3425125 RepID=UPI003D70217F
MLSSKDTRLVALREPNVAREALQQSPAVAGAEERPGLERAPVGPGRAGRQ